MVESGARLRPPQCGWEHQEGVIGHAGMAQVPRQVYPGKTSKNPGKPPQMPRRRYFEAVP